MNFAHSLGFDSAGWTCDDVSRNKGILLLGISTLVEGNSVVEQDLAVPADESLGNPGKQDNSVLADVVFASAYALKWRWHQSSLPKEGTEGKVSNDVNEGKVPKEGTVGKEAGAGWEPTSRSSPCRPKMV